MLYHHRRKGFVFFYALIITGIIAVFLFGIATYYSLLVRTADSVYNTNAVYLNARSIKSLINAGDADSGSHSTVANGINGAYVVIDTSNNGKICTYIPVYLRYSNASIYPGYIMYASKIGNKYFVYKINAYAVPYINVSFPEQHQYLSFGHTYTIKWKNTNPYRDAKIRILFYNGSSWSTVADNLPVTQTSYNWTVPSANSNNCRLRIGLKDATHGYWIGYTDVHISVGP
jgi:hypothetical protein